MTLYRHALVWLLRLVGGACVLGAIAHAITTYGIYSDVVGNDGDPGLSYLLDIMVPLVAALITGAVVALALAELLALQLYASRAGNVR